MFKTIWLKKKGRFISQTLSRSFYDCWNCEAQIQDLNIREFQKWSQNYCRSSWVSITIKILDAGAKCLRWASSSFCTFFSKNQWFCTQVLSIFYCEIRHSNRYPKFWIMVEMYSAVDRLCLLTDCFEENLGHNNTFMFIAFSGDCRRWNLWDRS